MSSRYHRVIAIGAHNTGGGLHPTSMAQLSGYSYPAAHPPHYCGFGRTGRTVLDTEVPLAPAGRFRVGITDAPLSPA
jgi:hypothetical protein